MIADNSKEQQTGRAVENNEKQRRRRNANISTNSPTLLVCERDEEPHYSPAHRAVMR